MKTVWPVLGRFYIVRLKSSSLFEIDYCKDLRAMGDHYRDDLFYSITIFGYTFAYFDRG